MTGKSRGSTDVVTEFLALPKEDLRGLEAALQYLWDKVEGLTVGVIAEAIAFDSRQKEERTQVRQAIVKRHRRLGAVRATVKTSKVYLQINDKKGLEMRWRRRKHIIGHPEIMAAARLPVEVSLSYVQKDAHFDELDLLARHHEEYKRIREEWEFAMMVKRIIKGRMQVTLNRLEKEGRLPVPQPNDEVDA